MTRLKDEKGFVLSTAMIVLMIVLLLGLALMRTVNAQTTQTGHETAGEGAFNLAESVMQAEAYQLQVAWPSTSATALPTCNQSTAQSVGCEGTSLTNSLKATYAGPDYSTATWSVQALDDTGGQSYYSDTIAATAPSWDANGDGRMWVRAQATVGGQKRIVVEQLVRQARVLTVPDNTVTAGAVYTENKGNKVIIQAYDSSSGLTGNVEVRCGNSSSTPTQGQGNCLGWDASKSGQLSPQNAYGAGYVDPGGSFRTLTDAQLLALKQTAKAENLYYNGQCPQPPPAGTSGVVYAENLAGQNCSYTGNATWNTSTSPGALVIADGTVTFNGNQTFYGVIYMANTQGALPTSYPCPASSLTTPPVVTVHGNAQVFGAIFVDRCGVVATGESKSNVNFFANALNGLVGEQTAMPAQNTFQIVHN